MNKIYNKRIVWALGMLAIFVLAPVVMPLKANAQYFYGNSGVSPYSTYGAGNTPYNNSAPGYVYSSGNTSGYSTAPAAYANYPAPAPAPAPAQDTTPREESPSNLAANAIYGSNSFLPSGIIQWIFFAILILLIVILARRIFGADKKYHETPLKHA